MTSSDQRSNFEKISEFHEVFDNGYKDPAIENRDRVLLRGKLMFEELEEILAELGLQLEAGFNEEKNKFEIKVVHDKFFSKPIHKAKVAKELADLLYVTYGSADTMDIPIDEVYSEVHKSNMSKAGPDGKPIYREDGKILKGPNYKPADIESIIKRHHEKAT